MKRVTLLLVMSLLVLNFTVAQEKQKKVKAEVLYFKAKLPCCKGRTCNLLQSDVDSVVTKYFANKKVGFRVIYLVAPENKELIDKYKAQSQTVLLIRKKRKNEIVTDLTSIVQAYSSDRDKKKFEADMKAKIEEGLK